jgi:hypothetical protein
MKRLFRITSLFLIIVILIYTIIIQIMMERRVKRFVEDNELPKRARQDFTPALFFEFQWVVSDEKRKFHSCASYEFSKPYHHALSGSQNAVYYYVYVTHSKEQLDSLVRCGCPNENAQ